MKRKTTPNDDGPTDKAVAEVFALLKRSEGEALFSLDVAYQYHGSPPGVYYSAPYPEMGESLWQAIRSDLRTALCVGRKPKPWVEDLISNDVRDLIIGVMTAMASTLSVPLAIAVPATAIVVKRGIATLCSESAGSRPPRTARQMLEAHKSGFKRHPASRRLPKGTKGSA